MRKLKNLFHLGEAVAANLVYGFPSHKIKVIGVTGTDGKTTTTHLIYQLLKSAGKKTSMISSVYADIGNKIYETGLHTTTPAAFEIQKFLSLAVKNHDDYFVLETTAHGLDQKRVWGVTYLASVLTNITPEHLNSAAGYDYFLTMNNYLRVKSDLLLASAVSFINKDDRSYKKVREILEKNNKKFYTYSLQKAADLVWDETFKTDLPGDYNRSNILAAFSVCLKLGLEKNKLISGLKSFKLPSGRLETVYEGQFKVVIDFAHTINGLEQVLKTVQPMASGRLIHVFGAAGLRDRDKRVFMGEVSAKYTDVIILTEEDYRVENPWEICRQIGKGVERAGKKYSIIIDREEAVAKAIGLAKKGDLVILTGKGHEKSLCRGTVEYPWNEKETVLKVIKNL